MDQITLDRDSARALLNFLYDISSDAEFDAEFGDALWNDDVQIAFKDLEKAVQGEDDIS